MESKTPDDRTEIPTLHIESARVVYRHFVRDNVEFDFMYLPDPIIYRLVQEVRTFMFLPTNYVPQKLCFLG